MAISCSETRDRSVIFSRGDRPFTARDVMDWALMHGELEPLWRESQRAAECGRLAEERDMEADGSSIDEASIAFRYAHDLITADETENWLERRGLALDDFSEYFTRQFWGRAYTGAVDVPGTTYSAASPEQKDRFFIDLVLSGELDRLASALSWRVAAQAAADGNTRVRAVIGDEDPAEILTQLGRDSGWLRDLREAEADYQQQITSLVTQKDLQRELGSLRLMLTRFEIEAVEVDSRDAAAEVLACVRSDGMQMAEVAEEGRYPFHRHDLLLEDIPAEQQQRFLSVRSGALLDPVARDDAFEVWRVTRRIEPSLEDAAIRTRIEQRLLGRHFDELVSRFIAWRLLPGGDE